MKDNNDDLSNTCEKIKNLFQDNEENSTLIEESITDEEKENINNKKNEVINNALDTLVDISDNMDESIDVDTFIEVITLF